MSGPPPPLHSPAISPLAGYLARTVRPWVTLLSQRSGRDGCPLHDPLALAAVIDPEVVSTLTASVGIDLRLQAGLQLPSSRPVTITIRRSPSRRSVAGMR